MSTAQQPEALRLADKYEVEGFLQDERYAKDHWCSQAAAELRRQHTRIAELEAQLSAIGAGGVEPLRKREEPAALKAQEENQGDHLFDAVLHCPHSITHESVTLHFYPRQKEGHNALAQLRHRLAAYDLAARQREMQMLGEIEALERLALNVLKQLGEGVAPQAVQAAVPKIDWESAAEKIAIEEADNCGKWLTVVYRDIQPGDEARAIAEHPKASALSWSHALHERDTAIAAQAKQGCAA